MNGVTDVDYQIRTMTRRVTPSHGWWRAYVVPAGAEIGRKLAVDATGATTTDHEWIVRYKGGAGVTLYYDNPATQLLVRRVSLDIGGVWRYLGVEEVQFNKETKALDQTAKGAHGYLDAGVKFFVGETTSGLFGFKLSFTRGALPPVFAHVDSFQFGFLMESK